MLALSLLIFLYITIQTSDSSKQNIAQHKSFDPTRDAEKDIQSSIIQATKYNKRILLDVGGEWCIWCHRLDSLFIQNKDLSEYIDKHYVVVKINVSKENENKESLSHYPKVTGYPYIFILEKNGIESIAQFTT